VVDDEDNIRTLVCEVLEEMGHRTLQAANGVTALDLLAKTDPIDLLITDIGLPGGFSGRQVARAMRMINPEQKILFITGYTQTTLEPQLLDAPGTALLLKPFPLEELADQALLMLTE